MNGECTIDVGMGQRWVACNGIQCGMGQPLTIKSAVPAGGSGSSGASNIKI